MPTSILIELFESGGMRYEWTQRSFSFTTSAIRLDMVTRMKYLQSRPSAHGDLRTCTQYAPKLHIDALVAFVLLLNILE